MVSICHIKVPFGLTGIVIMCVLESTHTCTSKAREVLVDNNTFKLDNFIICGLLCEWVI